MYDNAVNITSNNVSISIMLIGITLLFITEGSQLCILIFLSCYTKLFYHESVS